MLISQPGQALKEDRREESRRRMWENTHYSRTTSKDSIPAELCVCVYNLPCLLPLSLAAFLLHNSVTLPAATVLSESAPSISPARLLLLLCVL